MDEARLRSAAAEYPYLRGLVSVPAGFLFIVAALGNAAWGPFEHAWVFVLALVLIAGVSAAIARYYNEHYGRVTPTTRQQLKGLAVGVAGVGVMIGGSLLLRSRASWSLDLPVNPIAVTFAALMLAHSAIVAGLKPHHVLVWGSLFVIGALPVWDGPDPSNTALVLCGVAVIAGGVLDHLQLVRTFGPARLPTPDGAGG
jgi:hypothetical protein